MDTAYFLGILYVTLRIGTYFLVVDIFFPKGTPKMMKGMLALIISVSVVGGIDYEILSAMITNNYYLAIFAINEIMTGIVFGIITNMIFNAIKYAGSWMDFHSGFMMTSILDPATNTNSTLLGNLSYMAATVVFFLMNGHHLVLKTLIETFNVLPIGKSIILQETMMQCIRIISEYFILGVKIAIPLVLIIILIDLCLGLITRSVPTIPVMIFGIPIKVILGLFTYTLLLPTIFKALNRAISDLPGLFENIISVLKFAPVFLIFAEDDDKTEEATPKKMSDAKKKGQVAKSKEVTVAFTLIVCTFLIAAFSDNLAKILKDITIYFFSLPHLKDFNKMALREISNVSTYNILKMILIFVFPIMIAGIVSNIAQTGIIFSKDPLKPSFGKINPVKGFKNMFSKRSLVGLVKNIVVITIIGLISYYFIKKNYSDILVISALSFQGIANTMKDLTVDIFKKICIVMIFVSTYDFYMQKKMHKKEMKMSKQEVKDEFKNSEGDPMIKSKIKQKQRQIGMQRMMQSVTDATVVITNPTHLAIAIKYDKDSGMEVPKVVAKGADYVAIKIKGIAKENDVPMVENKPLARIMYERVQIDEEIPQDLYQGVAEILAVIMKINK